MCRVYGATHEMLVCLINNKLLYIFCLFMIYAFCIKAPASYKFYFLDFVLLPKDVRMKLMCQRRNTIPGDIGLMANFLTKIHKNRLKIEA